MILFKGVGSVPFSTATVDPNSDLAKALYGPGRVFLNQCRTKQNPQGWIPGTGGNSYPTPLDVTYTPDQWALLQMDTQIQHGADMRAMGYPCPSSESAVQQAVQSSPFLTPKPPIFSASPSVAFASSRGGKILYGGDTWTVKIVGAKPNAPVTVSGSMPSGPFTDSGMGTTDGNGNWSTSGTITADEVGDWNESWSVGGSQLGAFSFTVKAGTAPSSGGSPGGSQQQQSGGTASGGFSLDSIPWWAWVAGAGALYFATKGGR